MSTVLLNHKGVSYTYTNVELITILNNLDSSGTYYTYGINSIIFIRLNGQNLLLLDNGFSINHKLFELFTIQYDINNKFNLKFVHINTSLEYDIDQALLSVGYSPPLGTVPITNLEDVFMTIYTEFDSRIILPNDVVKDTGIFGVRPAEIKTLTQGKAILFSNDADTFTINADLTNKDGIGFDVLDENTQELRQILPLTGLTGELNGNHIDLNTNILNYNNPNSIDIIDEVSQTIKNLGSSETISLTEENNKITFNVVLNEPVGEEGNSIVNVVNNNYYVKKSRQLNH